MSAASDANAIAHTKSPQSRRTAQRYELTLHVGATGQRYHPALVPLRVIASANTRSDGVADGSSGGDSTVRH